MSTRTIVTKAGSMLPTPMLHRLLAPKLPVPQVVFAAADNPITGPAYMLRDWANGQRLEVVAHELTPTALSWIWRARLEPFWPASTA